MLREADGAGSKEFGGFATHTRLIAFVAVPHVGSRIANYLDALREILPSSAATGDFLDAPPDAPRRRTSGRDSDPTPTFVVRDGAYDAHLSARPSA